MSESVGVTLIAKERERQIADEGWTEQHDDTQLPGDLGIAGACYALSAASFVSSSAPAKQRLAHASEDFWPWGVHQWKPVKVDPIRQLVKAGALIAAEIDRLSRAKNTLSPDG